MTRRATPKRRSGGDDRSVERDHLRDLLVQPSVRPSPREQQKETVLQNFRTKAKAIGFTKAGAESILERGTISAAKAGTTILEPGSSPEFVGVVGAGCVKTVVDPPLAPGPQGPLARRVTVQFAKPSNFFGLVPPAGRAPGRFGAVAQVDSLIFEVGRDSLRSLFREKPELRLPILGYHTRALSRLICETCTLLGLKVRERLLHQLLTLQRDFPTSISAGMIDLPLTHQDLAEAVGAARVTVMRILEELNSEGLVEVQDGRYVLSEGLVRRGLPSTEAPILASPGKEAPSSARKAFESVLLRGKLGPPPTGVTTLVARATYHAFQRGQAIGVPDSSFAVMLISGSASVFVNVPGGAPVGICMAKPGHVIGTGWFRQSRGFMRTVFAVALEDCHVAVLSPAAMERMLAKLNADEMLSFLSACHNAFSRQLYYRSAMLPLSVAERLLVQLHVLAKDFPLPAPEGTIIKLPLQPERDLRPLVVASPGAMRQAIAGLVEAERLRILADGRLLVLGLHVQSRTG